MWLIGKLHLLLHLHASRADICSRILHDLLGLLTKHGLSINNNPIAPEDLGSLIDAVEMGRINCETRRKIGRFRVLAEAFRTCM